MARNEAAGAVADEQAKYRGVYRAIAGWAAFCFAAIVGFSRLSYGLLLPAIRDDLGGSYSTVGLVGTANFVGYLLGSLTIPLVLARYANRVRLNFLVLLAMNGALVLSASSLDLLQLGGWRFLIGFFSAMANILTVTLILERVEPLERGRASGLLWVGSSVGIVISGLIAPLILSTGLILAWRLVWIAMGLLGLVAAIGFYRTLHNHNKPSVEGMKPDLTAIKPASAGWFELLTELFRPRRLLFFTLAHIGYGFGYIIYSTFFITLLVQQGLPQVAAGLVWATMGVMAVLGCLLWGRAIDRWPSGFTLAASLAVGMLGTLGVLTGELSFELIGTALYGLFLFGPALIITVLLKRAVAPERYAASYGFMTTLFALGQLLGPSTGGIIVDNLGLAAGIILNFTLLALATGCAIIYGIIQRYD